MGADWQVIRRRGISYLTFGLPSGEVSAMTAIYGEPVDGLVVTRSYTLDGVDLDGSKRKAELNQSIK